MYVSSHTDKQALIRHALFYYMLYYYYIQYYTTIDYYYTIKCASNKRRLNSKQIIDVLLFWPIINDISLKSPIKVSTIATLSGHEYNKCKLTHSNTTSNMRFRSAQCIQDSRSGFGNVIKLTGSKRQDLLKRVKEKACMLTTAKSFKLREHIKSKQIKALCMCSKWGDLRLIPSTILSEKVYWK